MMAYSFRADSLRDPGSGSVGSMRSIRWNIEIKGGSLEEG